jgi:hypothetical protein
MIQLSQITSIPSQTMSIQAASLSFIVAGLALCILPCAAQNDGKISVRFLSFPKALEPVKVELRLAGEKTVSIEAPSNEFSQPLDVSATGVWAVGETVEGPDGKPVFKEYGRTKAVTATQQMLLLVRKGKQNADGFDLVALDGRADEFGGGKFLFMNAAKVDIAGTVGDEKFVVKPGQHMILKPKVDGNNRTAQAMFYFRKGDEARPFFSSRWPVNDHSRSMVFFYHDPGTMHLRLHTIRDFL